MREIKFRAWDKETCQMFHPLPDSVLLGVDYCELNLLVADITNGSAEEDDYILMQYTGLKDKNGKEIYEGDIVRAPHDFGPGGFSERTFIVHYHVEFGYQWKYWLMDQAEIIGNKFETPELLEES